MKKYKSTLDEEIICVSYNDTKDLPIDLHTNKYRYIKYEIEEVLKRQDDIEYMITDSKTTRNLLKEIKQLKKRNKEIYDGFMAATQELSEYAEENERYKLIIKALEKHFTDLEYYEDNEFLRQLLSVTDNDMVWLKRMAGDDKE